MLLQCFLLRTFNEHRGAEYGGPLCPASMPQLLSGAPNTEPRGSNSASDQIAFSLWGRARGRRFYTSLRFLKRPSSRRTRSHAHVTHLTVPD
jgi:hypothetical protein